MNKIIRSISGARRSGRTTALCDIVISLSLLPQNENGNSSEIFVFSPTFSSCHNMTRILKERSLLNNISLEEVASHKYQVFSNTITIKPSGPLDIQGVNLAADHYLLIDDADYIPIWAKNMAEEYTWKAIYLVKAIGEEQISNLWW